MNAISSWQAVLTELGSELAPCNTPGAAVQTPPAAAQGHRGTEFYTPLASAHSGTPVDAWYSILTTLKGDNKAANRRNADLAVSPGSRTSASPRAQNSPADSPSMVRQLFASAQRGTRQGPIASSPTRPKAFTVAATEAAAARHLPGSQIADAAAKQGGEAAARQAQCYHSSTGATMGCSTASSPQHRGHSPGASDTQQLADRITNLRASAESLLHSVSQASGPTGATASGPAAAQHASRSCSTQQDPLRALSSSSTAQQDALLPRQLFQSPAQLRAPNRSPSTTRQCLPSPAHGSRGAAGAGSSQHSSSTEAWQQGHAADTQGQEPLQQQLTGALRKVDNLLAGMAEQQQQQQPTPRPHSNNSSRHGNHSLPLSAVSRPPGVIQQHQQQHMMLHHQHCAGQGQEQQQQVLQQLLFQQQQLLQQLMPLIPRADGVAQAETSSKAAGITAFTTVPQGLQQAALAAHSLQQQGNPAAASLTGSQGGSSLAASMQYAASAASTHLQGSNSSTLGDVLQQQQQQHQASDGQTAAAALCRPGAMLVEELHRLQQTSVTCVSHSSGTHTGSGSAEHHGAGGGEGVHQGLGPPYEPVGAHSLAAEHHSSQGDNSSSSSVVQQLEPNLGIQLDRALFAAAGTTQSSSSNGSRFRACSSEGSGSGLQLRSEAGVSTQPQAQDVAAGGQLQHPGVSGWASNLQTSTENDTSSAASSAEEQQLPDTPNAVLPRVHTPGKPAAEVAAELSTPQLANSTAAIMTVSEAWRDESSSNQDKWQQLLAEWSAAEIDTWDDQRLTEKSAYFGRESCQSGSGQQASRAGSSSQQQPHSLPEQQQQHGLLGELASANGQQQQQQPGRSMQEEGWQPAPLQQHRQLQEEEQEQEHEVSFVFRGEQSSSPERMPAAVAPRPPTHSIPASTAGAGAGQVGSQACSPPAATLPEQQQQQGWDQAGAAAQQQSPAWPDSTRKQLFASAGSTSTSSSRTDLDELVLRPASQPNSTHGSRDGQAELNTHQQAATSHTGSSQSAVVTSGVLAAAAAAATVAAGGSQQAPVGSAADSPAAGATPRGQSSQQRQQQQQQLGVDRLNRLMLDLRGLQQRLNTIQLQTPRHTTRSPGDTSSGSTPAGTARTATSTDSVLPAASALPPTGQLVTPAAVAASSLPTGGPGSGRAAAAAGRGGVVTTPASAPVQYSAGVTSSGRAAASIALLKQRLQDSRAALQAIATPRQAEQGGPPALGPAGGAVQALQQAYSSTLGAATGAEQSAVQLHTPVADSGAAGAGAGAALQSYNSPLLQPGSAAGAWGLQGAVPAGEPGVYGMSHMLGQGIAGISAGSTSRVVVPASSAAPTAAVDTAAAAAAAVAGLSAGGPLRSASAWLTGGSLQQYLDRSRRSSRASSTQASAGGAANPASATSLADTPRQTDPNSHVQGLVHKWRAAAAATASAGAGAGTQQQQPYGLSTAGHVGKQPQQQPLGSTHTTPRGLSPRWGPVQAAAAAGATGRTGSAVPAATGWLSNTMNSTHAPVRHSGSQGRPDTGAVLRGFAASPTAGLVSPPSLLMFDGSCSHSSAAAAAAAGMSTSGPGTTHSGRQFTLPWPLSARGTQDTAASGVARGAALGMQYTPRNMVTPASGASTAYGSGGSRGDGSSTARSTGNALQGLHAAGGLTPRGLRSSTPPSTSSLTQWVQQGSPTSQLKQRLRTAALQHQALQQQQEQQRAALESPAAATLARNLATVDRTLAGFHPAPLSTTRRETALAARQQGAGFSSGHRPNTGPHGNSSGSNMAQAARSPSAVLAATAAAAEAAKSSLSGDAARARAARSTSPLQKLRMQQEALAMSSSTQLQGQRNPVVPVARSTAAVPRMPLAASYSTVALGPQR